MGSKVGGGGQKDKDWIRPGGGLKPGQSRFMELQYYHEVWFS